MVEYSYGTHRYQLGLCWRTSPSDVSILAVNDRLTSGTYEAPLAVDSYFTLYTYPSLWVYRS